MKQQAIICDIDGTLANIDHRIHFLSGAHKDWRSFSESCVTDALNIWCKTVLERFSDAYRIILVTGRYEEFRDVTELWLSQNHIEYDRLYMRADGDSTQHSEVKKKIYHYHIEPHYDVLFCIDDRQRVVEAWRELGLTCLQCKKGDY